MGKALKLVNKLKRRKKALALDRNGFDRRDKQDLLEEIMSPKALAIARKIQRRLDRNFGNNMIADEPALSKREAATLERIDFGVSDFGIQMTIDAAVMTEVGPRPLDVIKVLEGSLKGQYLKVVAVIDSTTLRLEDVASFTGPEDSQVRMNLSDVPKSYK